MSWVDWIFSLVYDIAEWFFDAANIVDGWVWPFYLLAEPLDTIGKDFWYLLDPIADFGDWVDVVWDKIREILSWDNIKNLIKGWLPGVEAAISLINNLVLEARMFLDDPITYLRDRFYSHILPWAIDHIPFFSTLYQWYEDFRHELQAFFSDPISYLRDMFEGSILPWAIDHIPFIGTLYAWYQDFRHELQAFFSNPASYLQTKFQEAVLPWAIEHIPFIATVFTWYDNWRGLIAAFFDDPIKWLNDNTIVGMLNDFVSDPVEYVWNRVADWFLGPEA